MADHIHPVFERMLTRSEREQRLGQRAKVLWFTGLSGSGKSTVAIAVEHALFEAGHFAQLLDGDNIRSGINNNLGFSLEDRRENVRRIAEVAKLYKESGVITLCSFISPTREIREMARQIIGPEDFLEVFVDTPLDVCESRDVKGLYAKARRGEIKGFTGIDSPYEAPEQPFLHLKTEDAAPEESAGQVITAVNSIIQLK
ncbi:adenylyl-sulfate kinase [Lewinellaceae bacterium SD302]|nr:adenylyl-sulfate kinase [Lewinellaceae bacterium SD302]